MPGGMPRELGMILRYAVAMPSVAMLLLMSLRGNAFLYYGEELGLTQAEIPFEDLQDPEAIANWPLTLSRDGARTPMPWDDEAANCGFSDARPWLRLGEDHAGLAVNRQEADPHSLLHLTRRLIALRKAEPALRLGTMEGLVAEGDLLRFERRYGNRAIRLAFNFGEGPLELDMEGEVLAEVNGSAGHLLPPFGGVALLV